MGDVTHPEMGQLQGHLDEAVGGEVAALDEALAEVEEGQHVAVQVP